MKNYLLGVASGLMLSFVFSLALYFSEVLFFESAVKKVEERNRSLEYQVFTYNICQFLPDWFSNATGGNAEMIPIGITNYSDVTKSWQIVKFRIPRSEAVTEAVMGEFVDNLEQQLENNYKSLVFRVVREDEILRISFKEE